MTDIENNMDDYIKNILIKYFNKEINIDEFENIDKNILYENLSKYYLYYFYHSCTKLDIELLEYIDIPDSIEKIKYILLHDLIFDISFDSILELFLKYNIELNILLFNDSLYKMGDIYLFNFIKTYNINVNYINKYMDNIDSITYISDKYCINNSNILDIIIVLIEAGYDYNKYNEKSNMLSILFLEPSYFKTLTIINIVEFLYHINLYITLSNDVYSCNYIENFKFLIDFEPDIDIKNIKIFDFNNRFIFDIILDKYNKQLTFKYMIDNHVDINIILFYMNKYNISIENIKLPYHYFYNMKETDIENLIKHGYDINNFYFNNDKKNICASIEYFNTLIKYNIYINYEYSVIISFGKLLYEQDYLSQLIHNLDKNNLLKLIKNSILYIISTSDEKINANKFTNFLLEKYPQLLNSN